MKKNNSLRIILSIVLIALVIALVYSIGRLIQMSQQPVEVKADLTAREVVVSNLSANSAVISWFSPESIESYISYGTESGQFTTKVLDYRDDTTPAARALFYVKINNLLPERKYYFQITAGTENFNTPEATYSFTTLKSTDEIGVPSPILISAPSDFVEGIAYVHASNGDNISTTASVYSTNPNITIDKSSLKDINTGKAFEIGSGRLLVSITSSDGKRSRAAILNTDTNIQLPGISLTTAAYTPNTIVTDLTPISSPVSSPTTSPGDTSGNPIVLNSCSSSCDQNKYCLCPSGCNNLAGVYQSISTRIVCGGDKQLPSTGGTPTPVPVPVPVPTPTPTPAPTPTPTLPSTDVNTDMALALNVFFGMILIVLGYQLRRKN